MSETNPVGYSPLDGALPEGWKLNIISDVASFVRGVTYKKSEARDSAGPGYMPLLRATNISSEVVTFTDYVFVPRSGVKGEQILRQNDLVIATSSGSSAIVGKSAAILAEFDGTFGAFCAVLRPSSEVAPRYVHLFAQSPNIRELWSNLARGTNINNLKSEQVLSTLIPIAPLAEQERIVEILEEQLSRLDAALESVRVVREKAAQFRRSLLHAAFTGTLTGHNPTDGQLPEGWTLSTLGSVAKWGSGGTPKSGTAAFYNGSIPWAVIGDLTEGEVFDTAQAITQLGLESSSAKVVEPGTVLLAMYGASIGRTGITAVEMATNQAIAFAKVDEKKMNRYFLLKYLQGQKKAFVEAGQGGAQPNISQTVIKPWPIPVPPLAEQERIVEILEQQLSRLDAALAVADAIEKRSAALRRSLLHAAFTGRLTEQWRELSHV
jgi:type I restriction enzyme S subunit